MSFFCFCFFSGEENLVFCDLCGGGLVWAGRIVWL